MGLFERGYGLVIGVSQYSDPIWNVPIAEGDADDLYDALIDPTVGGYDRGRVQRLRGSQATRDRVDEQLRVLAEQASPGDTVFISFTGHGALAENNLYTLGTSDTQFTPDKRQIRRDTGFSISRLALALKQIKAERLLVVINACDSGHLNSLAALDGLHSTVLPEGERKELLKSGKGRALITASRPDELSRFIGGDRNSFFGRALVSGLRGVDISSVSGYVGLFELYDVIYTQVKQAAAAVGHQQHPQINLVAGEGPFPVALYPGKAPGDPGLLQQRLSGPDVQPVTITIADNRKVIDFGSAQIGSVTFRGDVAQGDIIKTYHGGQSADDGDDGPLDPLAELPKLQQRISIARNVDEDARDDAAGKIRQALRALDQSDQARALQRIDEALAILDAMNNGYITSAARKLREVRGLIA